MPRLYRAVRLRAWAAIEEYRFPVSIAWPGGKRVRARVAGKHTIDIATPPEFKSGIEGMWSPEDFLVAAVGSCYAVTLVAVAGRAAVPLLGLALDAVGNLGRRADGSFGFTSVRLEVVAETEDGREADLRAAARRAERGCLVSAALDIPVELDLQLRERVPLSAAT